MNIGIDASRANVENRTGTEWYSFEVIKRLIAKNHNHQFILYLKDKPLPDMSDLGENVKYKVLRWPPKILWSLVRLSIAMIKKRPDVLFVPAHTIPIIHPNKTVTTLHDIGFEKYYDLYSKNNIQGKNIVSKVLSYLIKIFTFGRYSVSELDYHKWSARYAIKNAWKIITVSNFSKNEIVNTYKINENKISVIYNGYNEEYNYKVDKILSDKILNKYNISKPYFTFIGRLEAKKNIVRIIDAFLKYLYRDTSNEKYSLVLIGQRGLDFDKAEKLFVDSKYSNNIIETGWLPDNEAKALIQNSNLFLFPSLYEGFGIPVIEAFAANIPVITSKYSALSEVAGNAAYLINPNKVNEISEAIHKIMSSNIIKQELIKLGQARKNHFSWDKCAEKTMAILTRQ
ncbi:glycosyltransferase family 4 protein [Patescibacteria group bacterium]